MHRMGEKFLEGSAPLRNLGYERGVDDATRVEAKIRPGEGPEVRGSVLENREKLLVTSLEVLLRQRPERHGQRGYRTISVQMEQLARAVHVGTQNE